MITLPSLRDPDFARPWALTCAIIAAVVLAAVAVVALFRLLLLLVLGCALADLFCRVADPLARRLPGPRGLYVGLTFVGFFALGLGLVALFLFPLVDQADALARQIPIQLERFERALERADRPEIRLGPHGIPIVPAAPPMVAEKSSVRDSVAEKLPELASTGVPIVLRTVELGFDVLGVVFFAVFLAAAPEAHERGVRRLFPTRFHARLDAFLTEGRLALRGWIHAVGVTVVIVGVLATAGLWWIGVEYWLVFGVLTGALELAPYAGPFLGFVGPFVSTLLVGERTQTVEVLGLYVVLRALASYVITPYLVRKRTDVPASLAIASILLFGSAAGAVGVLAAVPTVALILVAIRTLVPHESVAAAP